MVKISSQDILMNFPSTRLEKPGSAIIISTAGYRNRTPVIVGEASCHIILPFYLAHITMLIGK